MKIKSEWESIDNYTGRMKVYNGWIVKYDQDIAHNTERGMQAGWDWTSCMVFVPDINHEWEIDN